MYWPPCLRKGQAALGMQGFRNAHVSPGNSLFTSRLCFLFAWLPFQTGLLYKLARWPSSSSRLTRSLLLLLLLISHFSRVRLCVTPYTAATRLPHPWDSPGRNTGAGCHFLLHHLHWRCSNSRNLFSRHMGSCGFMEWKLFILLDLHNYPVAVLVRCQVRMKRVRTLADGFPLLSSPSPPSFLPGDSFKKIIHKILNIATQSLFAIE